MGYPDRGRWKWRAATLTAAGSVALDSTASDGLAFISGVGILSGGPTDESTPRCTGTHDGDGAEQHHDENDDQNAGHGATLDRASSGTGQVDPGFDLDLGARGQRCDLDCGARRTVIAEGSCIDLVDGGKVTEVGDEDRGLGDVGERRAAVGDRKSVV